MSGPMVTSAHRLISNTAWNVFALIVNAVVAFLLIRFFLRHLGQARFGLWVLVGSLFRYRGIFSMGLNTAINRYVPMYLAAGDRSGLRKALRTALERSELDPEVTMRFKGEDEDQKEAALFLSRAFLGAVFLGWWLVGDGIATRLIALIAK